MKFVHIIRLFLDKKNENKKLHRSKKERVHKNTSLLPPTRPNKLIKIPKPKSVKFVDTYFWYARHNYKAKDYWKSRRYLLRWIQNNKHPHFNPNFKYWDLFRRTYRKLFFEKKSSIAELSSLYEEYFRIAKDKATKYDLKRFFSFSNYYPCNNNELKSIFDSIEKKKCEPDFELFSTSDLSFVFLEYKDKGSISYIKRVESFEQERELYNIFNDKKCLSPDSKYQVIIDENNILITFDRHGRKLLEWQVPLKETKEYEIEISSTNKKKSLEVLNLKANHSINEIREAYRKLVKIYHPDLNPDNPDAHKKMVEINTAYEELTGESSQNILERLKLKFYVDSSRYDKVNSVYFGENSNRIYIGCSSGKLYCLTLDGSYCFAVDCYWSINEIIEYKDKLFISTREAIFILRHDIYMATIQASHLVDKIMLLDNMLAFVDSDLNKLCFYSHNGRFLGYICMKALIWHFRVKFNCVIIYDYSGEYHFGMKNHLVQDN